MPLVTVALYSPWFGRWPLAMNASRQKDVIAVLPQLPSLVCCQESHLSALSTHAFDSGSIFTLSFSAGAGAAGGSAGGWAAGAAGTANTAARASRKQRRMAVSGRARSGPRHSITD